MRPEEREDIAGTPLTPEQIQQGVSLYSKLADIQTQYDRAVQVYGASSPITAAYQPLIQETKDAITQFNTRTPQKEQVGKKELTRKEIKDSSGKVVGYFVTYEDGTSSFIDNPSYVGTKDPSVTGPTGPTLAEDTFVATYALIAGSEEAKKPYVKELYKLVSSFYKTGSTIEDSVNLALYKAKEQNAIPEFTNRFTGIFKLQERRAKGEAIDVPTLSEYIKSQAALGDILRASNLGDLANENFLNQVMGTGKSVAESTSIIQNVFDLIDNAPADWKKQVQATMPYASRSDLAKALLTGDTGAKELQRKVNEAGIIASASSQDLSITGAQAQELLARGETYGTTGSKFGAIRTYLPQVQKIASFGMGVAPEKAYTLGEAMAATFENSAKELEKIAKLKQTEEARFQKQAGILGSKALASQIRGSL